MQPRILCLWLALAGSLVLSASAQVVTQPPVPEWLQHPAAQPAQTNYFQTTFQVHLPLLKAILLGASEGTISVRVNGHSLGQIQGAEKAASLDLTAFLKDGENILLITAYNPSAPAKFSCLLELNGDFAKQRWLVSDPRWRASLNEKFGPPLPARSLGRVDAIPQSNPFDPKRAIDAYNSWKLALGTNSATAPDTFTLPPGFKAELLRSAQPGEGSWVSMAFDPEGRLTLARERRGLLRLTFAANRVDKVEVLDDSLLECRGLLYAHGALYVNANNSKGFYRLRDADKDGRFEEVNLLLHTEGGVGHGRNHIVQGPDKQVYLVHGNNVTLPSNISPRSPLARYQNDSLLPCPFDDAMFDGDVTLPAGHILRTDPEGKTFELFAGAFRNPLDIAFNRDGEMFTFDADMEWDVGAPWYRPNRVNHVVPGADFGWRRGTAKWPDYLPDTLPSTLDIGLASPTGIEFGTGSRFPAPYNDALFIADWAYGRVLAIHLKPKGASYTAASELFMSGRPLNVTDLTFGPDGAMYLITGGRTTQSGLYRIAYQGPIPEPKKASRSERAAARDAEKARALRHQLESLQGNTANLPPAKIVKAAWPHLAHSDPFVRHAARMALERVDVTYWEAQALSERQTDCALSACLALARVGNPRHLAPLLQKLNRFALPKLSPGQQLHALRAYELACIRLGKPSPEQARSIREKLEPLYPSADWRVNHRLCILLVYLNSPQVIPGTLDLVAKSERSEDLLQYLFYLRYMREGWTISQRAAFLEGLARADHFPGARDYYTVLKRVRDEFTQSLSSAERDRLEPLLAANTRATLKLNTNAVPGQVLKDWQMRDFDLTRGLRARSIDKGKAALAKAQCIVCHRFGNEGGFIGPDLSAVGNRFDLRTLLESIIEPSKVVEEKFRSTTFTLKDGTQLSGLLEREEQETVVVRESPFAEKPVMLPRQNITRRETSAISPMPAGLINGLSKDEVLDLLFLLSAGNN